MNVKEIANPCSLVSYLTLNKHCHNSTEELAKRFQTYFREKFVNIRNTFPIIINPETVFAQSGFALEAFEPATEDEIRSIVAECGMSCFPETMYLYSTPTSFS